MAQTDELAVSDYQAPVMCEDCEGVRDVNSYCVDCKANVCDTCKPRRLHRKHRVLPRTHPEAAKARRKARFPCKFHSDKEYVTFCTICQEPCCVECISGAHDQHSFSEIETEARGAKEELTNILNMMEKHMLPALEESHRNLEDGISKYNQTVENSVAKCKNTFESLHEKLRELEKDWTKKILQVQHIEFLDVVKDRSKLEHQIGQMKNAVDECKTNLNGASNLALLTLRSECRFSVEIEPYKIALPTSLDFIPMSIHFEVKDIGRIEKGSKKK